MPWIESHTILIRHPKVRGLARSLRLRPSYVVGHLHALWHAALEQREDGDLSSWSDEVIADFSDYPGDAPQYVRLLQDHRWLDGKLIHDWLDYAGKFLISKYSSKNPQRLAEIWKLHGRIYGHSPRRVKGDQKASEGRPLPNPTSPTKPRGKPPSPLPPLPPGLDTPAMRAAFERWRRHREEIRKPLKPTMVDGQFRQFAEWGEARSVRAIDHTIAMGWQGLREPDPPRHSNGNGSARPSRDELEDARAERLLA